MPQVSCLEPHEAQQEEVHSPAPGEKQPQGNWKAAWQESPWESRWTPT